MTKSPKYARLAEEPKQACKNEICLILGEKMIPNPFTPSILATGIAILGLTLIITIHEFGHLIFCKIFGVYAPTFSIGMGPQIASIKIGETRFRLAALPLGGYVEFANFEPDSPEYNTPGNFATKPYWQKLCIMLGGISFNIGSAFLIYLLLAVFMGIPNKQLTAININKVLANGACYQILEDHDSIIGIKDQRFSNLNNFGYQDFTLAIEQHRGQAIDLLIARNQQELNVTIPVPEQTIGGPLGISIELQHSTSPESYQRTTLQEGLTSATNFVSENLKSIVSGIWGMFQRKSLQGAAGPLMIIHHGLKCVNDGLWSFLIFLSILSLNLAVINLFPLGIFDGGQVLTVTIEAIFRRPLYTLRAIVTLSSLILVGLLLLKTTYSEILTLLKFR